MSLQMMGLKWVLGSLLISSIPAISQEVKVRTPEGEVYRIHIDENQPFYQVINQIENDLALSVNKANPQANFYLNYKKASKGGKNLPNRSYETPLTAKEKEYIHYIVVTLGFKSWAEIWSKESTLEKKGAKLETVHPLRFLLQIFSEEELKAAIKNIHSSSIIWPKFKKRLFNSLTDEYNRQNLRVEYVQHFSDSVGVKAELLIPLVQSNDWEGLISTLIKNVPRSGKPDRYNI